jgi:hypothetical protein
VSESVRHYLVAGGRAKCRATSGVLEGHPRRVTCTDCDPQAPYSGWTAPDTQPAPASGEGEALREALAQALFDHDFKGTTWPDRGTCWLTEQAVYRRSADALMPIFARLVAERDEAREKVRRVEEVLATSRARHFAHPRRAGKSLAAQLWSDIDGALKGEPARAALGGERE